MQARGIGYPISGAVFLVLLLSVLCISVSAAPAVVITPGSIVPGDGLQVDISDIQNGDHYKVFITGNVNTKAGSAFVYKINDITLPFDLSSGTFSTGMIGLSDANQCQVAVGIDGTTVTKSGFPVSGAWTAQQSGVNLDAATYDVTYSGTAAGSTATLTLLMEGTKSSGDTATSMTLYPTGVGAATFVVQVWVNDALITSATVDVSGAARDGVATGDTIPSAMNTRTSYPVSITFTNTGTSTWTRAAGFTLHAINKPALAMGPDVIKLPAGVSIRPGESHTFDFVLDSGKTEKTVTLKYQMYKGKKAFGTVFRDTITISKP